MLTISIARLSLSNIKLHYLFGKPFDVLMNKRKHITALLFVSLKIDATCSFRNCLELEKKTWYTFRINSIHGTLCKFLYAAELTARKKQYEYYRNKLLIFMGERRSMRILNCNLEDEVAKEIGKFAVLWNCFERNCCRNSCYPKRIIGITLNNSPYKRVHIDRKRAVELADVLNQRREQHHQTVSEYVNSSLHPKNALPSKDDEIEFMEAYLEGRTDDYCCGCLLILYRIRCNLVHGLKEIEKLNDQLFLFRAANEVLESIF